MTPDPEQAPPNPQLEIERVAVCYALNSGDPKAVEDVLSLSELSWTDWAANGVLSAFRYLHNAGERIEYVGVSNWMSVRGKSQEFASVMDLEHLANVLTFRESVLRISEFGKKRAIGIVADLVKQKSQNPEISSEELEKYAWSQLATAGDVQVRKQAGLKPISYTEIMSDLGDRLRNPEKISSRIHTPFPELDRITRGFGQRNLIILASRPKQGKSAVAGQIGRYVAEWHGPVLEITLEMDTEELSGRFLSQVTGKNKDDHAAEDAYHEASRNLPFFFYERGSGLKLAVRRIRKFVVAYPNAKLVIVDQLGLVDGVEENGRPQSRNEIVGKITTTLKNLASQLGICILALHQIRRPGEKAGANPRPTMEDLKDSGKVEEDANMVLLLWRKRGSTRAKLIVDAHRDGDTGEIDLDWVANTVSYKTAVKTEPKAAQKSIPAPEFPPLDDSDFPKELY